jgi:hypothetical protein
MAAVWPREQASRNASRCGAVRLTRAHGAAMTAAAMLPSSPIKLEPSRRHASARAGPERLRKLGGALGLIFVGSEVEAREGVVAGSERLAKRRGALVANLVVEASPGVERDLFAFRAPASRAVPAPSRKTSEYGQGSVYLERLAGAPLTLSASASKAAPASPIELLLRRSSLASSLP